MITERQLLILKRIIEHYTLTREPISSKVIVDSGVIDASSATVRNDMSALEEKGLIEKVHTSSGRIPSTKGYRFYIDHLLEPSQLSPTVAKLIQQTIGEASLHFRNIFDQSAEILSQLTNYTAIVLGPISDQQKITDIKSIGFNERYVMIVLEIGQFVVESDLIRLPAEIDYSEFKKMIRIFREELVGSTISEVEDQLKKSLPNLIHSFIDINKQWRPISVIENVIQKWQNNRIHVSGQSNMLSYTEGSELNAVKHLMDSIHRIDDIQWILDQSSNDFKVIIGQETGNKLLEDIAVVTTSYQIDDYGKGLLAVVGPTSMSYAHTFSLLSALRQELLNHLLDD